MNLLLAFAWLVAAIGLFAWSANDPQQARTIPGTDLSLAWIAVVLVLYNLMRWWMTRQAAHRQRLLMEAARQGALQRRSARPDLPTDPTFDFTEKSPPRPPDSVEPR